MRRGAMLLSGPDGTALIVCTTCRGSDRGQGDGERLAAELARLAAEPRYAAVSVAPLACLWSCGAGVAVQLRAPSKIGYVMGGFVAADARDLLDFALAHAATDDGEVPFDQWPAGVLGHFIARTPPTGMVIA